MSSSKITPLVTGREDEYARDPLSAGECMRHALEFIGKRAVREAHEYLYRVLMNTLHIQLEMGTTNEIPTIFKSTGEQTERKEFLLWACNNIALEVIRELRTNGEKTECRVYCASALQNIQARITCHFDPAFKKKLQRLGGKGVGVSEDAFRAMVADITEQDPIILDG